MKSPKKSVHKSSESPEQIQSSLLDLFIDGIKDIYWAENHLTNALPKMQKAAAAPELQKAFATHLDQTKGHVTSLEKIFELIGEKVIAKKCDAMESLVEEGEGVINDTMDGTVARDLGLIMSAQKVEHYEIASYAGLLHLAETLGQTEVADILSKILEEEMQTDEILTGIAESEIGSSISKKE